MSPQEVMSPVEYMSSKVDMSPGEDMSPRGDTAPRPVSRGVVMSYLTAPTPVLSDGGGSGSLTTMR